ncbi:hypothetical protein DFP72DRAFT_859674 [Ephemerocybe angulata]|uniref:MYND-type domain-containing protein n=1 Tax=Ephemerocybe angulata TaxID=980116 RepID=A0A8H6H804_9AGAR|nr:hypothetical protein DFP72DRAFT_863008 [Tulosesus angulatus]KAF6743027.1 hypothetical protein DFP72DRAFT_859674 [Tulosesus angulatus]
MAPRDSHCGVKGQFADKAHASETQANYNSAYQRILPTPTDSQKVSLSDSPSVGACNAAPDVAAYVVNIVTASPVPLSISGLGPSDLFTIRSVLRTFAILSEHSTSCKPSIQCRFLSEEGVESLINGWEPLCSWLGFLLQFDPLELHGTSKQDCVFIATASINHLSTILSTPQGYQHRRHILPSFVSLLKLLWEPSNIPNTIRQLSDKPWYGREGLCPFKLSAHLLLSEDARQELFRHSPTLLIEIASTTIRSHLELLETTIRHDDETGCIGFQDILQCVKITMDLATHLSHDPRYRWAMLQRGVFTLGVRIVVQSLEAGPPDLSYVLVQSILQVLFETTAPLPYQMETLGQLLRGGLVDVANFYLAFVDDNPAVAEYVEAILKFITAHTSNNLVSDALHDFLDNNYVEFDIDPERSFLYEWYLKQSYIADRRNKVETFLRPPCSSPRCSFSFTNTGSRANIPCASCKKVAYCSAFCANEDWKHLHESECGEWATVTEVEHAEGRRVLPESEEIFLWCIRNVSEGFTHLLFPGNATFLPAQNREVTHCDLRRVPIQYNHSTFASYEVSGAFYIPNYLKSRKSAYILKAMRNRSRLRLVEFIFPYGTQAVVVIAILYFAQFTRYVLNCSYIVVAGQVADKRNTVNGPSYTAVGQKTIQLRHWDEGANALIGRYAKLFQVWERGSGIIRNGKSPTSFRGRLSDQRSMFPLKNKGHIFLMGGAEQLAVKLRALIF